MSNGPSLDALQRRLLDTPPDFLDPPCRDKRGELHVAAVVNDVLSLHGAVMPAALLATLSGELKGVTDNQLSVSAVLAWLLADPSWQRYPRQAAALRVLFDEVAPALAVEAKAERYVFDPDRREELARTTIARLGLLPEGETEAQAADRLASVSSVERRRLLDASRAAEERARAIREALARKAAEESADKWTRE
jgi:hypothetical protein